MRDLCQLVKPNLVKEIDDLIARLKSSSASIPQPFDQAILGSDETPGRIAVLGVISRSQDIDAKLRLVARAVHIEVPEVPPEDLEK